MKNVYYMICAVLLYLQACKKDRDVDLPHGRTSLVGWTAISSFPSSGRLEAFGFGIGNKGYLGAGFAIDSTAGDFWEYDPVNNAWTRKADFPGGKRAYAVSFSIGNKGYAGLGSNFASDEFDLWEYNTTTGAWTKKADFPGRPVTSNICIAFSIGDKGYIGFSSGDFQLYEYDPGFDRWTKKASFPGGNRADMVGFSVSGKGYVGLGTLKKTGSGPSDMSMSDIWEFDPGANKWTRKADFAGGPRTQAVAFSIREKAYVTSGITEIDNYISGLRKDLWEYDPLKDTWALQDLSEYPARAQAVGFSIGDSGFIGTGLNLNGNHYQQDFWKFTINSGAK